MKEDEAKAASSEPGRKMTYPAMEHIRRFSNEGNETRNVNRKMPLGSMSKNKIDSEKQ